MGKLDGRVAVITGAASGIGRATAKLFAQEEIARLALFLASDDHEGVQGFNPEDVPA